MSSSTWINNAEWHDPTCQTKRFMYVYSYSTSVPLLCSGIVPFHNYAPTLQKPKACLWLGHPPLHLAMAFRRVHCLTDMACISPVYAVFSTHLHASWELLNSRALLPSLENFQRRIEDRESPKRLGISFCAKDIHITLLLFLIASGLSSSVSPYLLTYPRSVPWRLLSGYQWISRLRRHTCFSEPSLQDDIVILHAWLSHPS